MKKKSLVLALVMICSLVLFSACGVVGSKQVTGVRFSTNKTATYKDKQVKCFMINEGSMFKLPYEVFPNTAETDAHAVFSHNADNTESDKFNFINGTFQIISRDFPETGILVTITINSEYTDQCLIKKADYPDSKLKDDGATSIQANSTYVFSVVDKLNEDPIDISKYNFKLTSSDESVIKVENNDALIVKSTGKRGIAEIAVAFESDCGKTVEIGKKTLNVVMNASKSRIAVGGDVVGASGVTMLTGQEKLCEVYLIDADGYSITDFTYSVNIIYGSCLQVDGNSIKAIDAFVDEQTEEVCLVEITTTVLDDDGNVIRLRFAVTVQKDE